jgi:RNA polymerase sigma-70 factor, ECF subfamily
MVVWTHSDGPEEQRMSHDEDHSCVEYLRDERLKELLAENLPDNFELLVLLYQHKLHTFVSLIYDRRYAEDLVQETFLNVYRALMKYPPSAIGALRLRPWLFCIAHNLARNHRRKYSHITPISIDLPEGRELLEESESGQCLAPDTEVEGRESRDELYMRIQQLPRALKLPVILHYIAEMSYEEVAKELDLPLNTVKSYGLRGLRRLQEMMKEEGR